MDYLNLYRSLFHNHIPKYTKLKAPTFGKGYKKLDYISIKPVRFKRLKRKNEENKYSSSYCRNHSNFYL